MRASRLFLLTLLGFATHASATITPRQSLPSEVQALFNLANNLTIPGASGQDSTAPDIEFNGDYTIPERSASPELRVAGVLTKRAAFLYGPNVAGGPYFPTGALGLAKVAQDLRAVGEDVASQFAKALVDDLAAFANQSQYDELKTVDDYIKLYDTEPKTLLPKGLVPGILTNGTQDLLFSMERLSSSPYQVRRLNPSVDLLAFAVDNATAKIVTGSTVHQLLHDGPLFYADYRDQANLTLNAGRYAANCDAYFYVCEKSGDFLPLAIRTNVGSNLIYTPADSPDDWLLAKIMYNVNDVWFAQWNLIAGTHFVVQPVYMAAIRTLSEVHPAMAILNRLIFEVFAIPPLAQVTLFNPGAAIDIVFAYSGQSAQAYSRARYTGSGGRFQANYFETDLKSRGLVNSSYGPELRSFPFYEDASTIFQAIEAFMATMVESFYSSDAMVAADKELQAWAEEANGAAKAIDFPCSIKSRSTLVDVLTHMAHLVSTAHHTVNTNELLSVSATLPFHPVALYKAPPISKGIENVADYLPPLQKVIEQVTVAAEYARPGFVGTNRTLLHMFDVQGLLSHMNEGTRAAAATFKSSMQAFSSRVGARAFDADGLSQGMPFLWQALDPDVIPYSITI